MANKRNTTSEAAMSAVERALDLDEDVIGEESSSDRKEPNFGSGASSDKKSGESRKKPAAKKSGEEAALDEFARALTDSDDAPIGGIAAANDDRPSLETLLYRLQRRPSSAPFMVAGLLGAV